MRAHAGEGALKSALKRAEEASQRGDAVGHVIRDVLASGVDGSRAIAAALNGRGIPSPSGGVWYGEQVWRTMARLQRV